MNVGSWNSDSINMLFSSVNSGKKASSPNYLSSLTSLLSDYNSIKTGSYGKLVKAYYAKDAADKTTTSNKTDKNDKTTTSTSTSTAEDSTKILSAIQSATDTLYDSAEKLRKEARTADDMNSLYDSVATFVEDYNKVIDAADESNTKTIQNSLGDLTKLTSANSKLLGSIGITVGEDGKMTLNEEKFKSASIDTAKSLFSGTGSYAYHVSVDTAMINNKADYQASKANTYGTDGNYGNNYTSGDVFDSLF